MIALFLMEAADSGLVLRLFQQHHSLLHAIAIDLISDAHLAEDLVSETFERLLVQEEALKKLSPAQQKIRAVSMLRSLCVLHLEREEGEPPPTEEAVSLSSAPEQALMHRIRVEEMQRALAHLPERHAAILKMRYLQEMNDEEIARILHIQKAYVRVYLMRARQKLRKILSSMM